MTSIAWRRLSSTFCRKHINMMNIQTDRQAGRRTDGQRLVTTSSTGWIQLSLNCFSHSSRAFLAPSDFTTEAMLPEGEQEGEQGGGWEGEQEGGREGRR